MLHYFCRLETLKKHLPLSVPEGLAQLERIAVCFEEKMYTSATSQVQLIASRTIISWGHGQLDRVAQLNENGDGSFVIA
jgi:hypothetical protein